MVVAERDPEAPVSRGPNCIKGHFLSKIMQSEDRIRTSLLRKRNTRFDRNGSLTPLSSDEACAVMVQAFKKALKAKGPSAVGMFGSGPWTVSEGYAAAKLMKTGFRSNNIDPNAHHCRA